MKLPEFLLVSPQIDLPGAGFVLQTIAPYYMGRVIKLSANPQAILNYVTEYKPMIYSQVANYNILIVFATSLNGTLRATDEHWREAHQQIFDRMAEHYLHNKINPHPGQYKRYLV